MLPLCPVTGRDPRRDCSRGGGRKGPFLIVALAALRDPSREDLIDLDDEAIEALATTIGIRPASVKVELSQLQKRGRVMLLRLKTGTRVRITREGSRYLLDEHGIQPTEYDRRRLLAA